MYWRIFIRRYWADICRQDHFWFIFTHVRPGTKDFNVDIYAQGISHSFTFFIAVPGFVPDHAEVDFLNLYTADDLQNLDEPRFRKALADLDCCSTDATGEKPGVR
jgi:hypothetical protein